MGSDKAHRATSRKTRCNALDTRRRNLMYTCHPARGTTPRAAAGRPDETVSARPKPRRTGQGQQDPSSPLAVNVRELDRALGRTRCAPPVVAEANQLVLPAAQRMERVGDPESLRIASTAGS